MKQWKIYDENLVGVQLKKDAIVLDKPRYIGMAILDISKIIMYRFHYDFIMKQYPTAKLLFTDTDSFCSQLPTENMYADIKGRDDWFDFLNYDVNHTNRDMSNKFEPGYFQDEMGGEPFTEFIGLCSKMYSMMKEDGKEKINA